MYTFQSRVTACSAIWLRPALVQSSPELGRFPVCLPSIAFKYINLRIIPASTFANKGFGAVGSSVPLSQA